MGSPEPCLLALEWQTVDDFVHREGEATNVSGVAADLEGNVYAVGQGHAAQKPVGVLRRSRSGGASWQDVPWKGAPPADIAADENGNLFVTVGGSAPAVLKSENQGESFTSLADIPIKRGGLDEFCNAGFVATGSGQTVAAGASCDSSGWVVLKTTDSGQSWRTAFTFQLRPGKASRLHDVGVDSLGRVYGVGYGIDDADTVHWLVVREGEAGDAVVSDDFQLKPGLVAQARGFGNPTAPIVVGFGTDGMGVHAIVRRQVSPDVWQTIDTFESRATGVAVSRAQLLVTGDFESSGLVRVSTRRSFDTGATWNPLPDYSYVAGQSCFSGQLAVDPSGNVYAGVIGRDATGVPHWVVRKLACQ